MKRFILLITTFSSILFAGAQNGFDLGVSGTFMNTYIWRQNNYGTLAVFANPVIRQSEMAYKATWGGQGGLEIGYNFITNRPYNIGFKIGIEYLSTGQGYEDRYDGPATLPDTVIGSPSTRVDVKRYVRLGYVVFPLLVKYINNKNRVAHFFAALGPQFGIRTYAFESVKIANIPYLPDSLNFTANQRFQTFDAGLTLQFGVDLYATNHLYFEVGLTGYLGLFDINGKVLQQLGWYDKNHVSYQQSHNTDAGLLVGLHYIIGRGRED